MLRFYTTHQAAELLGVSLPTVVNWIRDRRLHCHRTPGGHRRIAREELAAFMLRQGMPLAEELSDAAPAHRRALVLGDLGPAREGLARQLTTAGWAVEVASPGFAAGAALARYRPDAVVLLATQPDGGETLAALRADREAAGTPVVVVGHAAWAVELLAAGATVALARPVGPEPLAAAMAEAVGAQAASSASATSPGHRTPRISEGSPSPGAGHRTHRNQTDSTGEGSEAGAGHRDGGAGHRIERPRRRR
jgi:excisionase family DNA binding protein